MGVLTPSDVKCWDLGAIQQVFETASGRAASLQRLGENLQQVDNGLGGWHGEAGEAFRADLGKARRDIEADGQESRQVSAAVARAEGDVRVCKRELDDIERATDAKGWTITPEWRIDVGDTWIGRDPLEFAAQQQVLQDRLILLKAHADSADHELAAAVRAAVGGSSSNGVAKLPGGKPRSLEDMLLPDGPADTGGGNGSPSEARTPAAGAAGKPLSLQDMLLPIRKLPTRGQGDQPPPVPGVPRPQLKPADVASFKAMAHQSMIRDGVPPDQIEARLNDLVGRTRQWLDNGMPNYVPPEPKSAPPPGFGEGFGDRWIATEQGIKNLVGQGGPGAPGVLESWQQMLKGTAETAQNPLGAAAGEIENVLESPSPAYYLGAKTSDGAFALPGMIFGGEGAAVEAGLGDIGPGVLDTGPAVSAHAPVGFDHPPTYNSWAGEAATDLNFAFGRGGPTPSLSQQLADMSTHYVGDSPDRVVLGKFGGQEAGYIGDARGHGGIYFDTGDSAWDAITRGLSKPQSESLAWQVNEQFLRSQMESGVPQIDYELLGKFASVEDVLVVDPDSFSAMEIGFLKSNAEAYGYRQVGNSWVHVTDGR